MLWETIPIIYNSLTEGVISDGGLVSVFLKFEMVSSGCC